VAKINLRRLHRLSLSKMYDQVRLELISTPFIMQVGGEGMIKKIMNIDPVPRLSICVYIHMHLIVPDLTFTDITTMKWYHLQLECLIFTMIITVYSINFWMINLWVMILPILYVDM
jgi:hypothetical protein